MKHKIHRIHFVGIGGVGMSGIAEVLANLGYQVSGTDAADSPTVRRLRELGADVHLGHEAARVHGADCVVTSSAVRADNPEVREARARGIPVIARAMMLAELMKLKRGIAVAGTHGKTTTTSLVASVLGAAGLDPTYVIGGKLMRSGVNARLGTGDLIVVEADESDASFLNLLPMISVVTNIDADHMDTYGHEMSRLKQAFIEFLNRLPFYGAAVLCTDDPNVRDVIPFMSRPVIRYGLDENATVRAVQVRADGDGMCFTVERPGHDPLPVRLALPGLHNVRNALAAIAVAGELGAPDAAIVEALGSFTGVGRRFQRHGDVALDAGGRFTLVDDYGHHPTEMQATLAAARGAFAGRRIVLAFQPHRYSRTRDLFDEFVDVLCTADLVLLGGVYPAGEAPIAGADSQALALAMQARTGASPVRVDDIGSMKAAIVQLARDGDVVITMGAGSIGSVPAQFHEEAHD